MNRNKVALLMVILCGLSLSGAVAEAQANDAAAAAFESMLPVLHHPRCMNCHSKGDFPRQGDDGHRHTMNVRRGPDGDGATAQKCSTCHQDHNLVGRHLPPGAPDWRLPPRDTPMIWEGLSDHQLCQVLKDPMQNGSRSVEEIVEHMNTPLVLWAWNPGEGRTPVPVPQAQFLESVKKWAASGAACPAEKTATTSDPVAHYRALLPPTTSRKIHSASLP